MNTSQSEVLNGDRIGWTVNTFTSQPGLKNALPQGGTKIIRVFGEIPKGLSVMKILANTGIDFESFDSISIEIPPPGRVANITLVNVDGSRRVRLENTDLLATSYQEDVARLLK